MWIGSIKAELETPISVPEAVEVVAMWFAIRGLLKIIKKMYGE